MGGTEVRWDCAEYCRLQPGDWPPINLTLPESSCYLAPLPWLASTAAVTELSYPEAAAKVGGAANLERLRAVKARVDPANFFCHSPFAAVLGAAAAES